MSDGQHNCQGEGRRCEGCVDCIPPPHPSEAERTCEACGSLNTLRRWYYWGTCERCEEVKGKEKATPLPTAGAWARGEVKIPQ